MGPARAEVTGAADALWLHAEPLLAGGRERSRLPRRWPTNLREGTVVRDAHRLARSLRRAGDDTAGQRRAPARPSAVSRRRTTSSALRSRAPLAHGAGVDGAVASAGRHAPRRSAACRATRGPGGRDPTAGRRARWTARDCSTTLGLTRSTKAYAASRALPWCGSSITSAARSTPDVMSIAMASSWMSPVSSMAGASASARNAGDERGVVLLAGHEAGRRVQHVSRRCRAAIVSPATTTRCVMPALAQRA
jgi:hypothetical protein